MDRFLSIKHEETQESPAGAIPSVTLELLPHLAVDSSLGQVTRGSYEPGTINFAQLTENDLVGFDFSFNGFILHDALTIAPLDYITPTEFGYGQWEPSSSPLGQIAPTMVTGWAAPMHQQLQHPRYYQQKQQQQYISLGEIENSTLGMHQGATFTVPEQVLFDVAQGVNPFSISFLQHCPSFSSSSQSGSSNSIENLSSLLGCSTIRGSAVENQAILQGFSFGEVAETAHSPLNASFSSSSTSPMASASPVTPVSSRKGGEGDGTLDGYDTAMLGERIRDAHAKRARRQRKTTASKKPKPVKKTLICDYSGCGVACSSIPSLQRHKDTHQWRGHYAPVRCEACRTPLSNEFSVQRHIMRSAPTSRCYRLRIYSHMNSQTEVARTVRFWPKAPHGKKVQVVNLLDLFLEPPDS